MSKVTKIEKRTKDFIAALEELKKKAILPSSSDLAAILGIKSISTISEIKAERQNIQPEAWERFKRKFGSELSQTFGLETPDHNSETKNEDYKVKYYEQLEKHNQVMNEMFQTIKSQQETIHFLTTKQGNANGRTATAV